jgi:hypothetical protein
VTKSASSEAKKLTAFATSSRVPIRPAGTVARYAARTSSETSAQHGALDEERELVEVLVGDVGHEALGKPAFVADRGGELRSERIAVRVVDCHRHAVPREPARDRAPQAP